MNKDNLCLKWSLLQWTPKDVCFYLIVLRSWEQSYQLHRVFLWEWSAVCPTYLLHVIDLIVIVLYSLPSVFARFPSLTLMRKTASLWEMPSCSSKLTSVFNFYPRFVRSTIVVNFAPFSVPLLNETSSDETILYWMSLSTIALIRGSQSFLFFLLPFLNEVCTFSTFMWTKHKWLCVGYTVFPRYSFC